MEIPLGIKWFTQYHSVEFLVFKLLQCRIQSSGPLEKGVRVSSLFKHPVCQYPLIKDNQVWFKIQQQFCRINYPIL